MMELRPPNLGVNPEAAIGQVSGQVSQLADRFNFNTRLAGATDPTAKFPLNDDPGLIDFFVNWGQIGTDGLSDFNKVFSYEFVITKTQPGSKDKTLVVDKRLRLALPPTQISMSANAAVRLTVTQSGIEESSNGAPLRPISISGTHGVMNAEAADTQTSIASGILDYAFKNTIQAVNRTVAAAQSVARAFNGNPAATSFPINLTVNQDTNPNMLLKTGFYAHHNMVRFFDYYWAIKKTAEGRNYRLHFNMYKDRSYYDVTLNSFTWSKRAGTIEYDYSINMTAWKQRRKPAGDVQRPDAQQLGTAAQDPLNVLARAVTTLTAARRTVSAAADVLRGVRADADDVIFGPLRETILLAKDVVGATKTLMDLPQSIIGSAKASITSAVRNFGQNSDGQAESINNTVNQLKMFGDPSIPGGSALSDQIEARASTNLADSANTPESSSPSERLFQDPTKFAVLFDQINLDDVPFSQAMRQAIDQEQDRVAALTVQDFQKKRDKIVAFSNTYAEKVGAASATYNRAKGYNPPPDVIGSLNLADIELMASLNDVVLGIEQVIVGLKKLLAVPQNDYFRYYVNYAINNGLALQDANSKFLVPFPAGATLEQVAVQYLGNIDRWPEIAAINGLKAPYVDEEGYLIPLKGNGSLNTALVAGAEKLFVGAVVYVFSNEVRPRQFQVTKIDVIDQNNTLITFQDGDDLSPYREADDPQIRAFLPDTTNSTKLIAIPSQTAPPQNFRINLGPGVKDLGGLAQLSQTDFLLNSQGDFVVTSGGDILRAFGYTNLVQAAKIKLLTTQGSMIQRPLFGNPVQPGRSAAEINLSEMMKDLNQSFLADPRFAGILAGQAVMKGPAVYFDLLIGISGVNANLPITTTVPAR